MYGTCGKYCDVSATFLNRAVNTWRSRRMSLILCFTSWFLSRAWLYLFNAVLASVSMWLTCAAEQEWNERRPGLVMQWGSWLSYVFGDDCPVVGNCAMAAHALCLGTRVLGKEQAGVHAHGLVLLLY